MEEVGEVRPLLRRRRSSHAFPQPRSRRKFYAALAVALAATGAVVCAVFAGYKRATVRRTARSRRSLLGYSTSRLANVPLDLCAPHPPPIHDLLSHPLLSHPTPNCSLTTLHMERYAPLFPSYGNGRQRKQSRSRPVLTAHDRPRHHLTYFVALNLYSSATVLPSLIHALHAVITALGPDRFTVSIYENASKDETSAQLFLFARLLDRLGVGYTIASSARPKENRPGKRIEGLAELRNLALAPLFAAPSGTWDRILFLNDIICCEAEILELMLQHEVQDADMSCGMDYKELKIPELKDWPMKDRTLFYDLWIARDMAGLPFYHIKWPTGDWDLPSLPLPQSPSRGLFQNLLPFQVYSCFNGVTVIDAALFEPPLSLRFRAQKGKGEVEGEGDRESECFLLSRDIWHTVSELGPRGKRKARGARIQVVPRVSVGYEVGEYEVVRKDGNTTGLIEVGNWGTKEAREMVDWKRRPPKLVAQYPYARWAEEEWIPPF